MLTSSSVAVEHFMLATSGAPPVTVRVGGPSGVSTAIIAVGAALLGSIVGSIVSYRFNVMLEDRRREARSQIRRKAKVYTPARTELIAFRHALKEGRQFGVFGIARDRPIKTLAPPPHLMFWRELVEDGRALTSASWQIQERLNRVEEAADGFNEQLSATRARFNERGGALLASLGERPRIQNWIDHDVGAFLRGHLDELNIFGSGPVSPVSSETQERFLTLWNEDVAVQEAASELTGANLRLVEATDSALDALDAAIRRIADKYERESTRD